VGTTARVRPYVYDGVAFSAGVQRAIALAGEYEGCPLILSIPF
jgi:hypothetical protein